VIVAQADAVVPALLPTVCELRLPASAWLLTISEIAIDKQSVSTLRIVI
jgi:hypothetical protein